MIRKYHNHKLQTTLWHREAEPLNHHETPGRQIKQSNQLSLPTSTSQMMNFNFVVLFKPILVYNHTGLVCLHEKQILIRTENDFQDMY